MMKNSSPPQQLNKNINSNLLETQSPTSNTRDINNNFNKQDDKFTTVKIKCFPP